MSLSQAEIEQIVSRNLDRVHQQMQAALQRRTLDGPAPQLVAVTKYAEMDWIAALLNRGCRDLGESRPQQMAQRKELLAAHDDLRWHLIGHLQRNKVRHVLETGAFIHSINSWRLLERIDDIAGQLSTRASVLVQINVAGEEQKSGMAPADFLENCSRLGDLHHTTVAGLMTMAPYTDDEVVVRNTFRGLRQLRDEARLRLNTPEVLNELSMGMSGDFEIAIEEGSTLIRIGSSLFEGLESE
ncbi:YggS family pyridoxal phosphate-dependent enzyme [Rubinisphaera margarita]|uniref:YggS family pyridoxal phosphate-dependent enzyme n=1 Tax=Rubinisphaera margarita TaxID=2909586 RepID=UPI001EE83F77|nr:YggS family pyridoxal phosphate-dependent enzyme [Rubinisphaera margarita]MCG6157871.1 YggS family pyridoxal phosphate-dependent enzyme [Rubinisphaera margarita]